MGLVQSPDLPRGFEPPRCIDPFENPHDDDADRAVNGFMRKFGLDSRCDVKSGENMIHKCCLLASPPFEEARMKDVFFNLLCHSHWRPEILNAACGQESKAFGWRPQDILAANACKTNKGVKPAMLKMLFAHGVDPNEPNPAKEGKPALFHAAGTANLECCIALVECRADIHQTHNGTSLVFPP